MWKEGFVLCVHSPQWLICTERDLDNQKQTVRSDGLGEWRAGSQNQKRKSMKTGRQWWTVNRLERIWRRSGWQSLPPPRHHIFWSYNLPRCDDRSAAKSLSAVSPGDLVTCDAQMQKRQKYNLKVGAWWPMPFGGKCDSASASGSWEQNRTACRSTRNPIVTRRLQVSSFLQPENRPLLSTPVISVFKKRI